MGGADKLQPDDIDLCHLFQIEEQGLGGPQGLYQGRPDLLAMLKVMWPPMMTSRVSG